MRRRHSPKPVAAKINVTPMIDVVMVLIVFYLIVGKMASDQRADLPLPPSGTGVHESVEDALVIDVRRAARGGATGPQGATDAGDAPRLALAGIELSIAALEDALRAELATRPDRAVRIRADRTLPYGAVEPVIEAARRAGAPAVRLAAERTSTPTRSEP